MSGELKPENRALIERHMGGLWLQHAEMCWPSNLDRLLDAAREEARQPAFLPDVEQQVRGEAGYAMPIDLGFGGPALEACRWPAGMAFGFHDEPGEHDPCYVIMPDGAMLPFNHHAEPGVDVARARFVQAACNAAWNRREEARPSPGGGGGEEHRSSGVRVPAAPDGATETQHSAGFDRALTTLVGIWGRDCTSAQIVNGLSAALRTAKEDAS